MNNLIKKFKNANKPKRIYHKQKVQAVVKPSALALNQTWIIKQSS